MVWQEYTLQKSLNVPIEVETRTLKEVQEVLKLLEADPHCGVTRIMLDNMTRLDPTLPGDELHVSLLLHHEHLSHTFKHCSSITGFKDSADDAQHDFLQVRCRFQSAQEHKIAILDELAAEGGK